MKKNIKVLDKTKAVDADKEVTIQSMEFVPIGDENVMMCKVTPCNGSGAISETYQISPSNLVISLSI